MSYVALYRKFRPQTFAEVKGQEHVVRALTNQLINNRIGHAYLFTGTRGTGKTSAAKIFAKAVNCLHPINGEPCNECENCLSVNAGNFVDVVEVDAASNNGVDDIRRIIEEVRYTPVKGKYKVFIIDEAHMITGPAFNAFLKTLEEPPSYAVFILATTEPYKLPITILSRCQRYDFKRISSDEITANLAQITTNEQVEADERALRYIARIGDGSMRDSISLLDKCIAFNLGEKLTYDNVLETLGTVDTEVFSRIFRYVYASDAAGALNQIDAAVADGRNLTQFTSDLIWYIRNILMVNAAHLESPEMLGLSAENMAQLMEDARDADNNVLIRYIRILSETLNQLRASTNKQVLLEVAIIKLAKPQMEVDTQSLADRIRQLEAKQGTAAFSYNQAAVSRPQMQPVMTDPDVFADIMDDDVRITYDEAETDSRMIYTENEPDTGSQMKPAANEQEYRPTYDLCSLWPRIVDACSLPMLQRVMRKCCVSQPDEKTLRISAELEVQVKQLRAESAMHFMQEMAEKLTGMHIDIQVIQDNGGNAGASAFPEDVLSNINFNIGTEEK